MSSSSHVRKSSRQKRQPERLSISYRRYRRPAIVPDPADREGSDDEKFQSIANDSESDSDVPYLDESDESYDEGTVEEEEKQSERQDEDEDEDEDEDNSDTEDALVWSHAAARAAAQQSSSSSSSSAQSPPPSSSSSSSAQPPPPSSSSSSSSSSSRKHSKKQKPRKAAAKKKRKSPGPKSQRDRSKCRDRPHWPDAGSKSKIENPQTWLDYHDLRKCPPKDLKPPDLVLESLDPQTDFPKQTLTCQAAFVRS